MKIQKLNSYEDVRQEKSKLNLAVDAFLRRRGWVRTSSTPGSNWLWCKKVTWTELKPKRAKGRFRAKTQTKEIMTNKQTALFIQRALDDKAAKRSNK